MPGFQGLERLGFEHSTCQEGEIAHYPWYLIYTSLTIFIHHPRVCHTLEEMNFHMCNGPYPVEQPFCVKANSPLKDHGRHLYLSLFSFLILYTS